MDIRSYRVAFIVAICILALLVASPALSRLLVYPRTEFFTGLWLLDQNHKAEDYPFNISRNQNYSVYLGIGNQLGYCAYYLVEVKFRNQTQPVPTSFGPLANRTPSSLPSLYNVTAFVNDEEVWEQQLIFSFDYAYDDIHSRIEFGGLRFNGMILNMSSYTIAWDPVAKGFFGYLFFELWLQNVTNADFQYHERFVSLRLNMTLT